MRRAKSIDIFDMFDWSDDQINSFLKEIQSQTEFPLLKGINGIRNRFIGCAILDRSQLESISFYKEDCMLALLPKLVAQTQLKRISLIGCVCSNENL